MYVSKECQTFAEMLQVLKEKCPDVYRHIVGLIKFFTK